MLGMAVPVFGEIISKGYPFQEEQDLTTRIVKLLRLRAGSNTANRKLKKMPIIINLDVEMAKKKISLNELSERVGITPANLSILKTGKAKAIRFSTLEAICKELDCQPGNIMEWREK